MSTHAGRALVTESLRPAVLVLVSLTGAGVLLLVGQSVARAPVAPGPADSARLLLGLLPAVLGMALPVSLLFGILTGARAWREGGDWLALATAGHGARAVVGAVLVAGVAGAVLQAVIAHHLEPLGRRQARLALVEASGELRLQPGRPALVGNTLVRAGTVDGPVLGEVFIAEGPRVIAAAGGALLGAGRVRLEDGEALGVDDDGGVAWRLDYARAEMALEPAPPRVELTERSDRELRAAAMRLESRGRDAGPQWLALYKRSSHPLALPLLALLAVPLGARGARPGLTAAVTALAWWALLRVSDQALSVLGPVASAWLPPLGVGMAAAVAWSTWRAR